MSNKKSAHDPEPAVGVQDHDQLKLGAAPPIDKPALAFSSFLRATPSAPIPVHPSVADDLTGTQFALDNNDKFGVCVPTGFDNLRRMISRLLTGNEIDASWDDILAWYRSQNPNFDPENYQESADQGMVIQLFLEWLVKQGLIVGFAKVDHTNEEEMRAATYIFLGLMIAVNLESAQQGQTNLGFWDYTESAEWGGHCVMLGAYESDNKDDVISWQRRIKMTEEFRAKQLVEAWVVILPDHIAHPNFRANFNLQAFAKAYEDITGRTFPVQVGPAPAPTPNPEPNPGPGPGPDPHNVTLVIRDDAVAAKLIHAQANSDFPDTSTWAEHHFKTYFKLH